MDMQQHRERMAASSSEARTMDREIGRMRAITELLNWSATTEITRDALLTKLFEMGFGPDADAPQISAPKDAA